MRYNFDFYNHVRYTDTYKKQVRRRNKLIKKLYVYLANKYINKHLANIVKFKITKKGGTCVSFKINKNNVILNKIYLKFNPLQVKKLANKKYGLSEYYQDRNKHFTEFKYIKAFYRIAILHELYHAKRRIYNKIDNHNNIEELQADRFSIDRAKQELRFTKVS